MNLHSVPDPDYRGISYDEGSRTLAVLTMDGRLYKYSPVPFRAYLHALATQSLSSFLSGADAIAQRVK